MNAIRLQIALCEQKGYVKSAQFWKTMYDAINDHMVSYKRKRATELKEILKSITAAMGVEQQEKKGLFHR